MLVLAATAGLAPPHPLLLPAAASAAFTGRSSNPTNTFAPDPAAQYGASNYGAAVTADSPSIFWKLDETAGTTAVNSGSAGTAANGAYSASGIAYSTTPDATPREAGSAVTLNGTTGCVRSPQAVVNPQVFTVEVWFKTTTTSGGKLLGFGNSATATSSQYDRHLYMTNTGTVIYGSYTGSTVVITTPGSYNDGRWHQAAATVGASGTVLYLDGAAVGSNTNTVSENYTGYWRVGCDSLASWPNTPTSQYLAGQVDNAAVYPTALTASRIAAHWYAA